MRPYAAGYFKEEKGMSQAFVRHDEETEAFKGDLENLKKLREWLKIQEKKRAALESPESAAKIDPATREKWLREVIADMAAEGLVGVVQNRPQVLHFLRLLRAERVERRLVLVEDQQIDGRERR